MIVRRLLLTFLLAAAASAPAAAQRDTAADRAWFQTLRGLSRGCEDPLLELPNPHVINYREHSELLVGRMLRIDPATCPGARDAAFSELRARVGDPERSDVSLDLLRLLWRHMAAADPPPAAPYGRVLWLFDDRVPSLPDWPEAEREAWLERPETIALLEGRNAGGVLRTRRSVEHHAGLLLREGSPTFDPGEAVRLLETSEANAIPGNRQRLLGLLLDGRHLPPDYARASRQFVSHAPQTLDYAIPAQRELLRIGRLAAAAARTPEEQAVALRILSAAALDGRFGGAEEQAAMLGRIGPVPRGALAQGDAERIGRALDFQFGFDLPDRREEDPAELRPILLRGLVGPDGRIVATELVQSSGVPLRDRIVRGVWARAGHRVDLALRARARFVWVDLPPVDPLLTTGAAYDRWH